MLPEPGTVKRLIQSYPHLSSKRMCLCPRSCNYQNYQPLTFFWQFPNGLQALSTQSALEFCPIHCPNGRLGQDLGFGGSAFALKLPELLNRNLVAVRAKLGQTSCFPNGPQIWCPIGQ